jgi:RNA 3'-terminal phosphate cyclase
VLAGIEAGALLLATRAGPGLSPDSVTYVSAARNLTDGHGYSGFTGSALTVFPPAYPALLAARRVATRHTKHDPGW